jgi:hypothetical protein
VVQRQGLQPQQHARDDMHEEPAAGTTVPVALPPRGQRELEDGEEVLWAEFLGALAEVGEAADELVGALCCCGLWWVVVGDGGGWVGGWRVTRGKRERERESVRVCVE